MGSVNVDEPTPVSHWPDPFPPGQLVWVESEDEVVSALRATTRLGSMISSCGSGWASASGNGTGMRGNILLAYVCRISMMAEDERGCGMARQIGQGANVNQTRFIRIPERSSPNKYRKGECLSVIVRKEGILCRDI